MSCPFLRKLSGFSNGVLCILGLTVIACGETTVRGPLQTIFSIPSENPPDGNSPFYLPCGGLNDTGVNLPVDYATYAFPSKGSNFTDLNYGCKMNRLTDGLSDFSLGIHHSVPSVRPVNFANSRILVQDSSGLWSIIDRLGNIKVPASSINNPRDPRWNRNDPYMLYDSITNEVVRYDVRSNTFDKAIVKQFPEYTKITYSPRADLTGPETKSKIILIGVRPDTKTEYFGFDFVSKLRGPIKPMPAYDGTTNHPFMTPQGRAVINEVVYDAYWNELKRLPVDLMKPENVFGRDLNGDDIMITTVSNNLTGVCAPEVNGIIKINIMTGTAKCLLPMNWGGGSVQLSLSESGWVLASMTDLSTGTADTVLRSNWSTLWKQYMNELVLIRLDGIRKYRLGHHRSRPVGLGGIVNPFALPRAHLTPDAAYAVFDSNLGISPPAAENDFSDILLIHVQK